ncbi:sensor histidine kinase [Polluticaenibacter yanchengensis]|uniref:HAMP domain-containing sensor histidine kinase n=1 Tax=Polluticaenibacter yanchengensis TaxID=3014562 RepID=A0ABT4UL19_9BACT|nr:HAMP domain-containing sensor histidine kinase [Chitinophagaceae bacterium LY-5]
MTLKNGYAEIKDDQLIKTIEFPGVSDAISMQEIRNDTFYILSQSGLLWYDQQRNKVFKKILDSTEIRYVYQDRDSNIWVTTYGRGFYLYRNNKLIRFPDGPRTALKAAHSIFDNKKGNFIINTNDGLFAVKVVDLLNYAEGTVPDVFYYLFDKFDGLITNEFNGGAVPSYIFRNDSSLSYPLVNGLAYFKPYTWLPYYSRAKIFIASILINNTEYKGDYNEIHLKYNRNTQIKIKATTPYYGNPENIRLVYFINDSKNSYTISQDGNIILNSLSPGNYKISIQKQGYNEFAQENTGLIMRLAIAPPFYQTWFFTMLLALLFIYAAIYLARRRFNKLKEQSELLEKIVEQRTIDLTNSIKRLESSERALEKNNNLRDNIITMILHDIRSPLRFLTTISNYLYKSYDHTPKKIFLKKLLDLKVNTFSILNYSESFFTWASSLRDGFKISKKHFRLSDLFSEIKDLYIDVIRSHNNHLLIEDADFDIYTDYNILSLVIRNLIDNANKNTKGGTLSIKAFLVENKLTIQIMDTGKGLSAKETAIFNNVINQKFSTGFGSVLILSVLPSIKGKLHVKSEIGHGTIFTIQILLEDFPLR